MFLRENKPDIAISLHDQVSSGWTGEGGGGGGKGDRGGQEEGGGSQILIFIKAPHSVYMLHSDWSKAYLCHLLYMCWRAIKTTVFQCCVLYLSHEGGSHLAHAPLWAGPELTSCLH